MKQFRVNSLNCLGPNNNYTYLCFIETMITNNYIIDSIFIMY